MQKILPIDVLQLVEQNMPTALRKTYLIAFFKVLCLPMAAIYTQWYIFRREKAYILAHNGQVCRLRHLLNDKFDYTQRRITIGDGQRTDRDYVYIEPENKPQYLKTIYIELDSEFADTDIDFIIYLNGVLLSLNETNQLKNLTNYFKLAGKRYKIVN